MTRGPDGRWSALDGQAVYRSRRAAGAVYDAAVRDELTARLGVDWVLNGRGDGEIAGIPRAGPAACSPSVAARSKTNSTRTGQSGPGRRRRQVALATRTGKIELDGETLDARWLDRSRTRRLRARRHRPTPRSARVASRRSSRVAERCPADRVRIRDEVSAVLVETEVSRRRTSAPTSPAALVERDSTFTRHQVLTAVSQMLRHSLHRSAWNGSPTSSSPSPISCRSRRRRADRRAGSNAGRAVTCSTSKPSCSACSARPTPTSPPSTRPLWHENSPAPALAALGPDQVDMVRRVTTQGLAVEVVVGRAGTGKTYAMAAVRDLYDGAPATSSSASHPPALAARGLGDGAGIDGVHLPPLLLTIADHPDRHGTSSSSTKPAWPAPSTCTASSPPPAPRGPK